MAPFNLNLFAGLFAPPTGGGDPPDAAKKEEGLPQGGPASGDGGFSLHSVHVPELHNPAAVGRPGAGGVFDSRFGAVAHLANHLETLPLIVRENIERLISRMGLLRGYLVDIRQEGEDYKKATSLDEASLEQSLGAKYAPDSDSIPDLIDSTLIEIISALASNKADKSAALKDLGWLMQASFYLQALGPRWFYLFNRSFTPIDFKGGASRANLIFTEALDFAYRYGAQDPSISAQQSEFMPEEEAAWESVKADVLEFSSQLRDLSPFGVRMALAATGIPSAKIQILPTFETLPTENQEDLLHYVYPDEHAATNLLNGNFLILDRKEPLPRNVVLTHFAFSRAHQKGLLARSVRLQTAQISYAHYRSLQLEEKLSRFLADSAFALKLGPADVGFATRTRLPDIRRIKSELERKWKIDTETPVEEREALPLIDSKVSLLFFVPIQWVVRWTVILEKISQSTGVSSHALTENWRKAFDEGKLKDFNYKLAINYLENFLGILRHRLTDASRFRLAMDVAVLLGLNVTSFLPKVAGGMDETLELGARTLAGEFFRVGLLANIMGLVHLAGGMPVSELLKHGNFGLGTYADLDGEMIVLDGVAYRVGPDGIPKVASAEMGVPFALVHQFKSAPGATLLTNKSLPMEEVESLLSQKLPDSNRPYSFRIHGAFKNIGVRFILKVDPQNPGFVSNSIQQENITGTLVGFRFSGSGAATTGDGYHFHFIADDKSLGGHVVNFELESGAKIQAQELGKEVNNDPPPSPGGGVRVLPQAMVQGGAVLQGTMKLGGSQMIQKGGLPVMAPVPQVPVEEDDSNRVLNLWKGLLFKTSDALASRNPSPHRDELIRILNEIIKRNNAHEIQKLIESLQGNSLDVTSDGLIRLLEMRHLPNQPSLLARPMASKTKRSQLMGAPTSPFLVTPPGAAPAAVPVPVGH